MFFAKICVNLLVFDFLLMILTTELGGDSVAASERYGRHECVQPVVDELP